MSLKELTIEYHRLQDRADEHYDNFLSIYQGLESMDHSEKESQLLEARNYLGRASDDLRDSLALREQAYHHLGVDENHERWETRVAGWIDKNNELEGELARDSLELQPEEASEQHRSNWQQFLANQEELKAIKKEMAEEEEHMVPLEVPAEESTSGGSWKPVEWQAVDIDQEREDNAEFMEHEHVSFSMV